MWYSFLAINLARNICKKNPSEASFFVINLLEWIKTSFYKNQDIEAEMIFGFIVDLYMFGLRNKKRKVTLPQFAEYCIGLTILHCKNTDENFVDIEDFYTLIMNENIFTVMEIEPELQDLAQKYQKGEIRSDHFIPFLETTSFQEFLEYKAKLPLIVARDVLKRIEYNVFRDLDCNVVVYLNDFIMVLDAILKVEPNKKICTNLLEYLKSYKDFHDNFDSFISCIEKYDKEWSSGKIKHKGNPFKSPSNLTFFSETQSSKVEALRPAASCGLI